MPRSLLLVSVGACLIFQSTPASSSGATDQAAAQALFDEGVRLLDTDSATPACPKLEESNRIDPQVATQYQLGRCYEAVGRTASAWALFVAVADVSHRLNNAQAEGIARSRAQALEGQLAKLSITSVDAAKSIPGLVIKRDGIVVGPGMLGLGVPVDPGPHPIAASAPGFKPWSSVVEVAAGAHLVEVMVPALQADSPAPNPPIAIGPTEGTAQPAPTPGAFPPSDAVRIEFTPPAGETWSLRNARDELVCRLPCSTWVGSGSGLYLARAQDNVTVQIPTRLLLGSTHPAVATPLAARGTPVWSAVTLIASGLLFVMGITMVARGECEDSAGNSYYGSACSNPTYKSDDGVNAGMTVFFGLATAASAYWWIWSRYERLDIKEQVGASASSSGWRLGLGPGGATLTF